MEIHYLKEVSDKLRKERHTELKEMLEGLSSKEITEIRDTITEYDKLYQEGKEINAYLLISRKPKHIIEKMFGKERE